MVALPPERETTKSGLFIPSENSSNEQMRTSIGRIMSFGSTVGHGELYKDCRDFKVGDYVHYAYYAAGLPLNYKGIKIKFLVDDQIKCRIKNPDDVDKLYDY
jgi:co-chaperonin GroES (HSP10)